MLLKLDLDVQETTPEASLLNKSSHLEAPLSVNKFFTNLVMNWVTFVVQLMSDLDVQQTHLRGWFVEQRSHLGSSFRCDQILNKLCYELGHTLLSYLSLTEMFNKPT